MITSLFKRREDTAIVAVVTRRKALAMAALCAVVGASLGAGATSYWAERVYSRDLAELRAAAALAARYAQDFSLESLALLAPASTSVSPAQPTEVSAAAAAAAPSSAQAAQDPTTKTVAHAASPHVPPQVAADARVGAKQEPTKSAKAPATPVGGQERKNVNEAPKPKSQQTRSEAGNTAAAAAPATQVPSASATAAQMPPAAFAGTPNAPTPGATAAGTGDSSGAGTAPVSARPAPPLTNSAQPVVTVSFEQANIAAIDASGVRFRSGRSVGVGEVFPSGERLLHVVPSEGKVVTDRRIIFLKDGAGAQ